MVRFIAAILLTISGASYVSCCWDAIDPHHLAENCPVIVSGSIETVLAAAPGGQRSDDIASIRIDAIQRNELMDLPLKVGDLLRVRMIARNNSHRASTDINYPAKTKAVWLVLLTSQGDFRIDRRPEQKQPLPFRPKLGTRELTKRVDNDDRPVKFANPHGSKTTAEWIARQKEREAEKSSKPRAGVIRTP